MCSPSLRGLVLGLIVGAAAPMALAHGLGTDEMADDAKALLAALASEQRAKAALPLSSPSRKDWSFSAGARTGIPLDELNPAQRSLVDDLLKNGLSASGYETATAIMKPGAGTGPSGSPARFQLSIYGRPSEDTPWGWRLEGPDLSLNFTIADADNVAVTPAFFGLNEVAPVRGGQGILTNVESLGLALAASLSEAQHKAATLPGNPPGRLVTGNRSRIEPLPTAGLAYAAMNSEQRRQLTALVTAHARHFRLEIADEALNRVIAAGWDGVTFAWAGGLNRSEARYYRIQGPTFVIEFAVNQGARRSVQSVWRDYDGDFGRDLLNDEKPR